MGKLLLILALGLSLSGVSNAMEYEAQFEQAQDELLNLEALYLDEGTAERPRHGRNMCPGLKLSDAQKKSIKTKLVDRHKYMQMHMKEIMASVKTIHEAIKNKNDEENAKKAFATISANVTKMVQGGLEMKSAILFDILEKDQRMPAAHCAMKMKKRQMRKMCRQSRRHRRDHHRGGGHTGLDAIL